MNLTEFNRSDYINEPHIVLFGNPVGHSLSPLMHNTAIRYHNLNIRYYAVKLEEQEMHLVDDFLQNEPLAGVNLTIPFKYQFMTYCRSLDSISSAIKAVNALVKRENKWRGYNSDGYGFSIPLKKYSEQIANEEALLFGTGGAARAVAYTLKEMDLKKIVAVSRNPVNAGEGIKTLVDSVIAYPNAAEHMKPAKLIVNTTPLGMDPHAGESPVKDNQTKYLNDKICYDLIYNPAETKFLAQAARADAATINGLEMLIHQGSKLFELWTGKEFPVSLIENKLQNKFDSKS